MRETYIVGVSMTPFGRFAAISVAELAARAAREALTDAGLAPSQVHGVAFANALQGALEGQHGIRGQASLAIGSPVSVRSVEGLVLIVEPTQDTV